MGRRVLCALAGASTAWLQLSISATDVRVRKHSAHGFSNRLVWIIRRFVEQRALTMGRRHESKHCGKLYYRSGVRAVSHSRWNMPAFPRTPVLPDATPVGALSAQLRRPRAAIRNVRSTSTPAIRSRAANAASRPRNWITELAPARTTTTSVSALISRELIASLFPRTRLKAFALRS